MKKLLPLLLLIPLCGFRPVAVTTQSAKGINENFNSLASEIERRSLNQGGIVHQNLKISSSAHVTGDFVVDGDIKATEITVSTITSTVGAAITVGCLAGFTKVTANSMMLGCIQTAEEGTGTWHVAVDDCFDTYGGRLPTSAEWYIGMANYSLTDEADDSEWHSDTTWDGAFHAVAGGGAITTQAHAASASSIVYRCWIPSEALILN